MINRKQIIDLLQFRSGSHSVLSFYMGIGVFKAQRKAYEIEAKDIMKRALAEAGLSGEDRKRVEEDVHRILNFLKMDFKGRAKGLAIFASKPAGLWQVFRLPVTVPDRCVVDSMPFVLPVLKIVDEGRRHCVVIADKEKARLFTVYLGEILERTEIFDAVPGWHKQGGWAQARFQRHIEDLVNRHLKHVADTMFSFYKSEGFGHVIIGGSQEVRTRLYRILHSYLQSIVAGYIPIDVSSNINDILTAARKIEQEVEERRAKEIAGRLLLARSGQGNMTVTGLKNTVAALHQGRVHTLVLVDNFEIEGCLCGGCGSVEVMEARECTCCQKEVSKVGDVSEHLAVLAVEHDAEVNYVLPESGLEEVDGVGAILRW
jgi:peptide chain release factor subunit 1